VSLLVPLCKCSRISTIVLLIVTIITYLISKKINRSFIEYETNLKDINTKLEEKVEEKTKELRVLNEELEIKIQEGIEELNHRDRTLEQQSKMVALGEMIGNIAHQWRQPLNAISIAASGIKLKNELQLLDEKELISTTDSIVKNTNYLSQVIDDFRNYIKGEKEFVKFDINTSVQKAFSIFESSVYNHKIKVFREFENDIFLENFLNELIQALVNILNNAKDALKNIEDEDDRIMILKTYKKDNNAIISIQDSAGGIPTQIIDKVFEPYFTTKDKSQGTGLGLYMTYQIITESMGGVIDVYNSPFQHENKTYTGANFIIQLPINKDLGINYTI